MIMVNQDYQFKENNVSNKTTDALQHIWRPQAWCSLYKFVTVEDLKLQSLWTQGRKKRGRAPKHTNRHSRPTNL